MKITLNRSIGRYAGPTAAAFVVVLALSPQKSDAQIYGTYGAVAGGSIESVPEYNNGGIGNSFATGEYDGPLGGPSMVSNASLGFAGEAFISAEATLGKNASFGSYASGTVWDTITTGVVPVGASMTLFGYGTEDITQGFYNATESVGLGLSVYQGGLAPSNEIGAGSMEITVGGGTVTTTTTDSTPGFNDGNPYNTDFVTYNLWEGVESATFYVQSNTQYFFELEGGASEEGQYSTLGNFTLTAELDPPSWSLTTSPGVTYTTASGIPIGGNAAAPEPDTLTLIAGGLGGFALGFLRRRQRGMC